MKLKSRTGKTVPVCLPQSYVVRDDSSPPAVKDSLEVSIWIDGMAITEMTVMVNINETADLIIFKGVTNYKII
ncbi:hypothetical protein DERF_011256 [Dermatophagoides farinae]|uniref:Uncharacterized protein n=1 Tax=Dermatophagoides farinae TaxID=6954 RepID=A0A922L2X1_DERFA|nr:hypothetical protein DERF_011256 [Dermatophagoides farinae]